ncbi:MAG: low molecular weight protein-tyrosine-phosphatase [Algisphaera sp.]
MPQPAILFVCLGNICRSPAAEAVFNQHLKLTGKNNITVDSAGTINHHAGNPADPRMMATATKRNITLTSIARQVTAEDFQTFDLIVAMDSNNHRDLLNAGANPQQTKLLGEFLPDHNPRESATQDVPDPYYGGQNGFDHVLDLLEAAMPQVAQALGLENA